MPQEPAIPPFPLTPDPSPAATAARLRLALGMQREGTEMLRLTLGRRYPDDTPEQRRQRLSDWLAYTPDLDDPRFEVR